MKTEKAVGGSEVRLWLPDSSGGFGLARVNNGLAQAIGYNQFGGFPGSQMGPTVSREDTLFYNLRYSLITLLRQEISQAYVEIGFLRTLVDVPVDDGLRGGVEFKSKQLDEDDLKQLQTTMDRKNDLGTAGLASKWNRLFGGAGIVTWVHDQDPSEPLDEDAIGPDTDLRFFAADMWELLPNQQNTTAEDMLRQDVDFEHYTYYSFPLHKTRVMRMKGIDAPSFVRMRLRGWGCSILETVVRPLNTYLKATDVTFEVLDEFKVDVYKIMDLVSTLASPDGGAEVFKRVQMGNWQKNYQHALVMDKNDDYDHKQLSFAGLAEITMANKIALAAELRMPVTKLFGTSLSNGFSTDQNDMENYNSMVEATVRNKLKYDILRMAELRCQQLFGYVPDDLEAHFKPLRELTAVDAETVKTQKYTRLLGALQAGVISTIEFREASNKGDLFDVKLDTSTDELNPDDPEVEGILDGSAKEEADAAAKAAADKGQEDGGKK